MHTFLTKRIDKLMERLAEGGRGQTSWEYNEQ